MSAARSVTLTLDPETLEGARSLAEQRGLSVAAFLRGEIAAMVAQRRAYEAARRSAVLRLRRARALGRGKPAERESLHDRDDLR